MKSTTRRTSILRRLLYPITALVLVLALSTPSFAWFMRSVYQQLTERFSASSIMSYFAGGTGTEDDPYKITLPQHLYNLAWLQNSGFFDSTTHFILVNDIDMAGSISGQDNTGGAIPPIGTKDNPFVGHFDGNGCVISNLWVSTDINDWKERPDGITGYSSSHVGMFGAISGDAIVENFNLDRVEVKSHIDATIGIICGYADANISGVGVYNGILTVASGVTCQSEYSLLGEISSNISWQDKPTIDTGSGEGDGGSGGDLVITPEHFSQFTSVAQGSTLAVDGALEGTAFYVGSLTVTPPYGGTIAFYDMRSGTPIAGLTPDPDASNYKAQQKVLEAYQQYQSGEYQMYLYPAAVPDVSNTVGVTINGETVQLPANGIWFKPQAAGIAALAFAKTNNANPAKKMAIYKYQRNSDGSLTEVSKTTFELPRSLKNGAIVYYEYEITKEDVTAGYEYVIGAADSDAANGSAGFVALVLAGTDESSGDNPGGGDTPGDGKRVLNIDYIVSTDVDVSSSTYEMHQTLLEIPSSTSTIQGSIYYKAVGTVGNSTVNYYVPSMGITVNDISQTKQSAAATDASQFEPRQQSAS